MGCHTILGEGAYYAPELTKVLERRGPGYVKAVLMSPIPWEPNGRKMVAYDFSEQKAADFVAFFNWIDEIDLNGFDGVVLVRPYSIQEPFWIKGKQKKMVILISDGKPNDYDKYEGKYGINDVKQALRELNSRKINSYALAIEAQAKYYLPQMFG